MALAVDLQMMCLALHETLHTCINFLTHLLMSGTCGPGFVPSGCQLQGSAGLLQTKQSAAVTAVHQPTAHCADAAAPLQSLVPAEGANAHHALCQRR